MTTPVRLLTMVPRVPDLTSATRIAKDVVRWSDELDADGILLFTGAGAVLDPWTGAAAIAASTRRMVPLVALNPLYTHPYAAARSVLSIGELYHRRVDLNLITGAAISELTAVGDTLDHRDRYARLREYVELFLDLLDGRPITRSGRFYQSSGLHLAPAMPAELRPRLYLAGQSEDARETAEALGADSMNMLSTAPGDTPPGLDAVLVGVLARDTAEAAEEAARRHFPDDPVGREVLRMSLANTDSVWKQSLAATEQRPSSALRLTGFQSFQTDSPYLVGDYDSVVDHLGGVAAAGVRTFILNSPTTREDFQHLGTVFRRLRSRVEVRRAATVSGERDAPA